MGYIASRQNRIERKFYSMLATRSYLFISYIRYSHLIDWDMLKNNTFPRGSKHHILQKMAHLYLQMYQRQAIFDGDSIKNKISRAPDTRIRFAIDLSKINWTSHRHTEWKRFIMINDNRQSGRYIAIFM